MSNSIPPIFYRPIPTQPEVVVPIESESFFELMWEMVNLIHQANPPQQYQYNPMRDYNIRLVQANVNPPQHTSHRQIKIEGDEEAIASDNRPRDNRSQESRIPEASGRQPSVRGSGSDRERYELPPGFKIPDLTDHRQLPFKLNDKEFYQKMVMELMEKIARILKAIKSESLIKFDEKANRISENVEKNLKINSDQRPSIDSSNNELGVQSDKKDPEHQIELVLQTVTPEGNVEEILIERGDLNLLLHNLNKMLDPQSKKEMSDTVEEALSHNKNVQGNQPQAQNPLNKSLEPVRQGEVPPMNSSNSLPPIAGPMQASAMASFMPFTAPLVGKEVRITDEEAFKIGKVDEITPISGFGTDTAEGKDTEKPVAESVLLAKAGKKTAKQKEVQEIAKTATNDQKTKKSSTLRIEDEKILPIHGKFTVDNLKGVRRRKGKNEETSGGGTSSNETHRLIDIFYMVLCAVVCGSQTIFDVTAYIESKEKWFTNLLGLRNGLPSSKLMSKLLVSFNATQLSEMLNIWIREAQGAPAKSGLASIIVMETFEGILFAQEKGHASTLDLCLPRLLQFMDLRRVVMLLSNDKGMKKFFDRILSCGANYIYDCGEEVLPEEEKIIPLFENAILDPKGTKGVNFVDSYIEGQEYLQLYEMDFFGSENMQSVSQVIGEIHSKDGKEETVQYFTSSVPKPSVWLFELLRTQRKLEGKTEWSVNMSMRGKHGDEASFAAREFFALIRRYASNLLLRDQWFKAPVSAKQQRAAKETDYLLRILQI